MGDDCSSAMINHFPNVSILLRYPFPPCCNSEANIEIFLGMGIFFGNKIPTRHLPFRYQPQVG